MPAPIYFSHKILEMLSKARRSGELKDLQPDAKSQVSVRYVDGKAVGPPKWWSPPSMRDHARARNTTPAWSGK